MRVISKLVFSKWCPFIALCTTFLYMWFMELHTRLYIHIMKADKKTILVWAPDCDNSACAPFDTMKTGKLETSPSCLYQNCFVQKSDLSFYEIRDNKYDAILFHGSLIQNLKKHDLPFRRSPNQIYVFVQLQPAHLYPICQPFFDDFFNWTMTYRLDSDIPWTFFKVKDLKNNIVAPDLYTRWAKEMAPIDANMMRDVETKKLLAAAIVNGGELEKTWRFVQLVNRELSRRYNQTVDIFGPKGTFPYNSNETEKFNKNLQKNYFFYMNLESTLDRDYVTEQVMIPLNNKAVPIMWGHTDFARFLPPGSYIDAYHYKSTKSLVDAILRLAANRTAYAEYLRWRRHYTLHNTRAQKWANCELCKMLNEEQGITRTNNLRRWWNEGYMALCGPMLAFN